MGLLLGVFQLRRKMSLGEVGLRLSQHLSGLVDDQGKILNLKFPTYQNNNTLKAKGEKTL